MTGLRRINPAQAARGTLSEWAADDPILSEGEFGWEEETGNFKIGDDLTPWSQLPYAGGASTMQRLSPAVSSFSEGDRSLPTFHKLTAAAPLIDVSESALASVYWPWVQHVVSKIADPIDDYYMWTSTDHMGSSGAIELWTAPSPAGPWASQGQIYKDTTTGSETETPSVIWDEPNDRFIMFYQQSGTGTGEQSTLWATSTDGENWTRQGVTITQPDTTTFPPNGHTGYFRPFRVGGLWGGYSLCGNDGRSALWWSHDGVTWRVDPRLLLWGSDITEANDKRLAWPDTTPIMWRGQLYGISRVGDWTSGGDARIATIVAYPMSPDARKPIGPARQILALDGPWEDADVRSIHVFADDRRLWLYYNLRGGVGLAVSEDI